MDRKTEILNGTLSFPKQIMEIIAPTEQQEAVIQEMWETLWYNFLIEKSIDTLIWYDQMNNQKLFNKLLVHLSKAGWINSVIDSNYAYIELLESKILKWITKEELSNLRFQAKWNRYRLNASSAKYAFYVYGTGNVNYSLDTFDGLLVRPTFYLNSTIKIKSGDGSFENPYTLG